MGDKTCPVDGVIEINFNDEPFLTDFKQAYAEMHSSGCPFAHSPSGDHYAVASHARIMEMLRKYGTWKSKFGPGLNYQDDEGVLVSVDPPGHTFEVRIVSSSFSDELFRSMIPEMEQFVGEQLDEVFADGAMDLHEMISIPFPLFVIFRLLGIPLKDGNQDRTPWIRDGIVISVGLMLKPQSEVQEMMATASVDDMRFQAMRRTQLMFVDHLDDCKKKLEAGVYQSDSNIVCRFLTTPGPDGTFLTDQKILGFMGFLLTAGSATTTIMLSNIIHRLLTEPAEFEKLRANPNLIPLAIEETLRLDSPVQGLFRTNDEEMELGPLKLEKDTKVLLLWAGANLDPEVFEDPMAFSLDRDLGKVKRHLSFGYGTHFCRGAPLARLEGEVFLRLILARLPNLRLNGEVVMEKRIPVLQGIRELPIAWDVKDSRTGQMTN